jgi:hypothetical protein
MNVEMLHPALGWILPPILAIFFLLLCSRRATKPTFKSQHRRLYPDLYTHPGYISADPDVKELKRRIAWLSKRFPSYTPDKLQTMVEAGFRGEVRACLSINMAIPSFARLELPSPLPKHYVGNSWEREKAQTVLKMDLIDAVRLLFHSFH